MPSPGCPARRARRSTDATRQLQGGPRFPARPSRRLRHRLCRLPLAGRTQLQLGAGLVRRRTRARRIARHAGTDRHRGRGGAPHLRRTVGALQPRGQRPARPRRGARRPAPADARQYRAALGGDAGGNEARRRRRPRHHAAHRRRPRRTCRPRRRAPGYRHRPGRPEARRPGRTVPRITVGGAPPGCIDYATLLAAPTRCSHRAARPAPTIRCCSISRPGPRPSRSWCCTATPPTRSVISRRCTG